MHGCDLSFEEKQSEMATSAGAAAPEVKQEELVPTLNGYVRSKLGKSEVRSETFCFFLGMWACQHPRPRGVCVPARLTCRLLKRTTDHELCRLRTRAR